MFVSSKEKAIYASILSQVYVHVLQNKEKGKGRQQNEANGEVSCECWIADVACHQFRYRKCSGRSSVLWFIAIIMATIVTNHTVH